MRHFLSLKDYSKSEIEAIVALALETKKAFKQGERHHDMQGKTLAMIFEKSSTRTRVSFETGVYQLGGQALFLSNRDIHLGRGEPIEDTARVISSMTDMVMIRTFAHSMLEKFASFSSVPVINGLTDSFHPVQLLADYMTMLEHGFDNSAKVAYVGDGNNMAHSWLMLAAKLGLELRIATPIGYEVDAEILLQANSFAKSSGAKLIITNDVQSAVTGVDIVTTDTWASMGQEDEKRQRIKDFKGFKVDEALFSLAHRDAKFLHCLPAYREQEVSASLLESKMSLVFEEAENRLHAQKGLMQWLCRAE